MTTKGQIISQAYEELRISGLTTAPDSLDIALALNRLEGMMYEFLGNWNLKVNYNFTQTPSTNNLTMVPEQFRTMMFTNLACRLIAAFNKPVPEELKANASQSLSAAIGIVQANNLQMVQPSRRMPVGSGNTYRGLFWNRFMTPLSLAPDVPETKTIQQGETESYFSDFSAELGAATISSYTIVADPMLTIVTSANASPRITYTVSAPDTVSGSGPLQNLQIVVTASDGSVIVRTIAFNVFAPPVVPSN